MASPDSSFTTKELSIATWPAFERLFSQGNGWDHCWCMAFQRDRSVLGRRLRTRAEIGVRNHEQKRQLVESRSAHGILVYVGNEPAGWCQFGPGEELTSIDRRKTSALDEATRLWRITCFVTDKKHRRRGVAGFALRAALESIRKQGGGLVEGYPVAHWHIDREFGKLTKKYGRHAPEVCRHLEMRTKPEGVFVRGVGPLAAAHGGFGNVSTQGTVSMFEKAGFRPVAVVSRTHVLMQRTI
jgi:ribosomal protein S18 acetylase RimI-like enzyme